jgi:hypothetical protein
MPARCDVKKKPSNIDGLWLRSAAKEPVRALYYYVSKG